MGRDLLCKMGAMIKCNETDLKLNISVKNIHLLVTGKEQLHKDLRDLLPSLWVGTEEGGVAKWGSYC